MTQSIHQDSEILTKARASEIKDLFLRYQQLATKGPPTLSDFDPNRLAALLDDLMILEPDSDDFVYRHVGSNIAITRGIDRTGQRTSLLPGDAGSFVRDCYRAASTKAAPLHTFHYSRDGDEIHLWERLILPLVDTDDKLLLVVFSRPREFHRVSPDSLETLPSGLTGLRVAEKPDGSQ